MPEPPPMIIATFVSVMCALVFDLRAKRLHQTHEFGKGGGDHVGVVYRHRILGCQSHDEEAHGNPVVEMSLHRRVLRHTAKPLAAGHAAHGKRSLAFGTV